MKSLFFLNALLWLIPGVSVVSGYGQVTTLNPLFQTTFYIQDALGNRDSVVLGFDPLGNNDSLNPLFGEAELPWTPGAIFESRVSTNYYSYSKKKISHCVVNSPALYGAFPIFLFVRAQHQPLTFSWDHNAIQNVGPYQKNAFMTPDLIALLQDTYEWNQTPGRRGTCLATHGSYVVTLTWDAVVDNESPLFPNGVTFGDVDAALGLIVFFSSEWEASYCSRVNDTGTPSEIARVSVYPNPATERIYLNVPSDAFSSVVLTNVVGRVTKVYEDGGDSSLGNLDVSDLPQGYYIVQGMKGNQSVAIGKFFKVE